MTDERRSLGSDNHSGIHPKILEAMVRANVGHAHSYGRDPWTKRADGALREAFGPQSRSYYVFNGTAANVLAIDSLVASHQSVLCARSSHLWQDECGAPERFVGAKLVPIEAPQGKLSPADLDAHLTRLGDQHASQPGAFSITQPTELGTLYTLEELGALGEFARAHRLGFHIDGARLTNAAAALGCSLRATSFDAGADVLSFGGTKHGLLHAEAVVFPSKQRTEAFRYRRKQGMQLPSKTRFMAAQFEAFMEEELWREIAGHANEMAGLLRREAQRFEALTFPYPTEASCVFATIPKTWVKPLRRSRFFYVWDPESTLVRWSAGFDTSAEDVAALCAEMARLDGGYGPEL